MKSAVLAGVLLLIAVTVHARVNHQSTLDSRNARIEAEKTRDDELFLEKIEREIAKDKRNGHFQHSAVKSSRFPDLTETQKQRIVDMHNEYRRQEGASDMALIEYDNNLERLAKDWAQRCNYGHRPGNTFNAEEYGFDRVGESIWAYSAGASTIPDKAVEMWYGEKKDYTYGSAACSDVCGHYTAVVWANTSRVGCAHASCSSLSNTNIAPADYIVCNYGRGQGNYQQDKPYEKGEPCTGCLTGVMTCDDGLCDDTCSSCECKAKCKCGQQTSDCRCTCDKGWVGPLCKDQCSDLSPMCGQNPGYPEFFCNPLPGMEALVHDTNENCPKQCKICEVGDGSCKNKNSGKSRLDQYDEERRSELEEEVENLSEAEIDLLVAALQKRADKKAD